MCIFTTLTLTLKHKNLFGKLNDNIFQANVQIPLQSYPQLKPIIVLSKDVLVLPGYYSVRLLVE